jgi:uncharacterized protein YndB with AHSA1/START domain
MSVKREPDGRRTVQVEVEVPGTPEQVWAAIATGPGISAWFVPATVEERLGGKLACTFGPGMDSVAKITGWDPPRRLTAESEGWMPGAPPMATEWSVTAKAGGTCIVRVVHSLFASTDDWDNQLEATEGGWPTFFAVLRLYLAHHAGQPSAIVQVMQPAAGTIDETWSQLARPLGLADKGVGQAVRSGAGAPPLAGTVERVSVADGRSSLVRLTEPSPGAAVIGAYSCGGVMAMVSLYLWGPGAAATAQRERGAWEAWLGSRFAVKA